MKQSHLPAVDGPEQRPPFWTLISRALRRRCPRCGKSNLFCGYLTQVEVCRACQHPWKEVRADDAPTWITILLVGHIMAPLALEIARSDAASEPELATVSVWNSLWFSASGLLVLATLLVLMILPFAKSVFIGLIWFLRAHSDA